MVYVWYMFSKHIPCLKLLVDRHLSYVVVEGYMFPRINCFCKTNKEKACKSKDLHAFLCRIKI